MGIGCTGLLLSLSFLLVVSENEQLARHILERKTKKFCNHTSSNHTVVTLEFMSDLSLLVELSLHDNPPKNFNPYSNFSCVNPGKSFNINFFSYASEPYYPWLALNAYSALANNPNSAVEIVVENRINFLKASGYCLSKILTLVDGYICVREYEWSKNTTWKRTVPNTPRFMEVPHLNSNYTYIGDIDIVYSESVLTAARLKQMERFNLPYSNVVRLNTQRLTGVMLVRTADFYTPAYLAKQQEFLHGNPSIAAENDEHVLYLMCEQVHGLPHQNRSFDSTHRPVHGLHLSPSRGVFSRRTFPLPELRGQWCPVLTLPKLMSVLAACPCMRTVFSMFTKRLIEQILLFKYISTGGKES